MEFILILIYEVWAIFSGYRTISGKSYWLDDRKPFNIIVKFILCWFIGNIIGAFYIFYLIVRLILRIHS